jgi:hypothetical protein
MTIQPNTQQRDLVRLALLVCGERTSEKYRAPEKGTGGDRSRGYDR